MRSLLRYFLIAVLCIATPAAAYWHSVQQTTVGPGNTVTPTTWNPSGLSADLSLSNGNLTVTNNTGSTANVKSIFSSATNKYYFEGAFASSSGRIGFGNSSSTQLTIGGASNANSIGYVPGSGQVLQAGSIKGTADTSTTGQNIGVAIDIDNSLVWIRIQGGDWNAAGGSADPATGLGGFSFTSLGAIFAIGQVNNIDEAFTANFGATAFTYTVPAGFKSGFGT